MADQGKRRVTLDEIAKVLGVSKFTVSRALSGKPGVSDRMREQVFTAARQLGYPLRPVGPPATHPAPVRGTVVMLLPAFSAGDTDFWPRVLLGAQAGAQDQGTSLVLAVVSEEDQSALRLPGHLDHIPIAGFLCTDGLSLGYVAAARQRGYPVVLVDNHLPALGVDAVMADNYEGARLAVRYLIEAGHRHLGFVGNNHRAYSFRQRWLGFRDAVEDAGLPLRPEWTLLRQGSEDPWDPGWIRQRLQDLAELPTAWFCTNDLTAFALLRALAGLGLQVPDDVSVVGFDDVTRAASAPVPLTTVHFPMEAMGRRCVERLYQRLARPDDLPDVTLLSTHLVIRDSVRPPRVAGPLRPSQPAG